MDSNIEDGEFNEDESSTEEVWPINDAASWDNARKTIPVHATEVDGMVRLHLSKITQQIVGCEIGENVTTEYPWIFVKKDIIEDNLDLHTESSDFLPVQNEIFDYPDKTILIGLAPIKNAEDNFYVCLTEDSRDAVIKQIDLLRSDQETRVKKSVFREVRHWRRSDDGRGDEADEFGITPGRAPFQTEITVKGKFFETSLSLTDRNADDQRDGYVQLIPTGMTLNSITNRLVSEAVDTNPQMCNSHCQTSSLEPVNSWFQYAYNYKPINTEAYNQDEARAMQQFLKSRERHLNDGILTNTLWDIHTDDSIRLVKNEMDTQIPVPVTYVEYQNYHNQTISGDKIINDLCWHPLRTGIAIVAYGSRIPQTPQKAHENNFILVWSLSDSLAPKLQLDSHREVSAVAVNPINGNIILGGCRSGQIIAWSIEDKINDQAVPKEQLSKSKIQLRKLMSWMKLPKSSLDPTGMSVIEASQCDTITGITWFNRVEKIDKSGKFVMPMEERIGWGQFVTCSEDGTVFFWNIWNRDLNNAKEKIKKKSKNLPLLFANVKYELTPVYKLIVKHPKQEHNVIISTMSLLSTNIHQGENSSGIILLGTSEGDVGAITWNGLDYVPDLDTGSEVATWLWMNDDTHDGPITHSVRSKYFNDVVVTIGGQVFAIWSETFHSPILYKRTKLSYTAVSWGTSRPTVVILARSDGAIEIWDFYIKSHEAVLVQSISSTLITGIYTHQLPLNPQCIAFCDANGAMRIFFAPQKLALFEETHIGWMRSFVDREIDRIKDFEKWQPILNEEYRQKMEKLGEKQGPIEEGASPMESSAPRIDNQIGKQEMKEKVDLRDTKPSYSSEKSASEWKQKILKNMQDILLEKKGLKLSDIDKRQAPVLNLRREEENKQRKVVKILETKEKIFNTTRNAAFPEASHESKKEQEEDVKRTSTAAEDMTNEEIIRQYKEVEKELLESMKQWKPPGPVDWPTLLREGEQRRRSLDVELKKMPKKRHKAPIV